MRMRASILLSYSLRRSSFIAERARTMRWTLSVPVPVISVLHFCPSIFLSGLDHFQSLQLGSPLTCQPTNAQ